MSNLKNKGKSVFRPRARIIKTLGEELISNDIVGVIELVKNSYDADAEVVEIKFSGIVEKREIQTKKGKKKKEQKRYLKKGGMLTIWDDGVGMSLDTVKNSWMEPATISKKQNRKSNNKERQYTGEKGIGRFAAAKIASKLIMTTQEQNSDTIEAEFDWSDFKDDAYLDQIESEWKVFDSLQPDESGTKLSMVELREDWSEDKIKELRLSLSRLINPVAPVPDFVVALDLPKELKDLGGFISPPKIYEKPFYSLKGELNSSGEATLIYSSRKNPKESFSKKIELRDPIRNSLCGSFKFEFRAWDLDDLSAISKDLGLKVTNVKRDIKDLSGVSIYRDNFRVLPYGEAEDDWLRLDARRVNNPTLRLSNNQIVGYILIELANNPELKDQSNREGLIDSQALIDLKESIISLLHEMEERRYQERPRRQKDQLEPNLFDNFSIAPLKKVLNEKLPGDQSVKKLFDDTEKKIEEGINRVSKVISRYRRLSTLGMIMDVILHDGNNFLLKLDAEAQLAKKKLNKPSIDRNEINNHLSKTITQGGALATMFDRLKPFGGRKMGRPKKIVLEEAILNVFDLYSNELKRAEIEIEIPSTITEVTIDNSEFQIIFVNLLTNSIFWLENFDGDRKIHVELQQKNDSLIILFSDSGPGITSGWESRIFEPYQTTKSNGVGLGLTIVGEIVSQYDGELKLVDGPLEGASFEISFGKRV